MSPSSGRKDLCARAVRRTLAEVQAAYLDYNKEPLPEPWDTWRLKEAAFRLWLLYLTTLHELIREGMNVHFNVVEQKKDGTHVMSLNVAALHELVCRVIDERSNRKDSRTGERYSYAAYMLRGKDWP